MSEASLVSTNIRITPQQRQYIRDSGYSLSKLVRVKLTEMMEKE